jgi:hypothetical protein
MGMSIDSANSTIDLNAAIDWLYSRYLNLFDADGLEKLPDADKQFIASHRAMDTYIALAHQLLRVRSGSDSDKKIAPITEGTIARLDQMKDWINEWHKNANS